MTARTYSAFGGDAVLKQTLATQLERAVTARSVYPCPKLIWQPQIQARSVSASLIEGADEADFEARIGIPIGVALLHESILYAAGEVREEADGQWRYSGPAGIANLSLDWLLAIRPGADLTGVVPQFALWTLVELERPDSDFAKALNNTVRDVCTRLRSACEQDLGQRSVAPTEWNDIRRAAVQATNSATDPWSLAAASFIESIAWPPHDVAQEFKDIFWNLFMTMISHCERAAMTAEQRENQEALFMQRVQVARSGGEGFKDANADLVLQRALAAERDPTEQERLRQTRKRAEPMIKALAHRYMETLIKLSATA